ncbi:MAG: LytTR family DNA-binding domain-containing protein [Bacteroidota bacterium]
MKNIGCLIIDDEELAREGLRMMLSEQTGFELLGTCSDGLSAIEKIEALKPDLIFLDVQMPGINGFEVIASISKPRPYIIFTTAYEQYAIKAFEVSALDYLLKPFTDQRFKEALVKAQEVSLRDLQRHHQEMEQLLSQASVQHQVRNGIVRQTETRNTLIIKSDGKVYQIIPGDILYVEAYDYYIKIHIAKRYFLVRETMKGIMNTLDQTLFVRVHKSYIVNLTKVKTVGKDADGYLAKMVNDVAIKVSRSYRKTFIDKFKKY